MILLVYITTPTEEEAVALGKFLVESRLAAGANIMGPGRSIYHWRNEICDAPQWLLFLQTTSECLERLEKAVLERHSHTVPCIIALPLQYGYPPFLQWITANCAKAPECESH